MAEYGLYTVRFTYLGSYFRYSDLGHGRTTVDNLRMNTRGFQDSPNVPAHAMHVLKEVSTISSLVYVRRDATWALITS